ncbi:hypothetical protein ACNF49_20285 [Actinomadura sp. ATCC 39365]
MRERAARRTASLLSHARAASASVTPSGAYRTKFEISANGLRWVVMSGGWPVRTSSAVSVRLPPSRRSSQVCRQAPSTRSPGPPPRLLDRLRHQGSTAAIAAYATSRLPPTAAASIQGDGPPPGRAPCSPAFGRAVPDRSPPPRVNSPSSCSLSSIAEETTSWSSLAPLRPGVG